jgi:HAD superfamily hydrolase (TIGR01509 family)
MLQAIVFDFDGVIINTEMADVQAWRTLYGRYGVPFSLAKWQQNIGSHAVFDAADELLAHVPPGVTRATIQKEFEALDQEAIRQLTVMPGMHERMGEARTKGLKLAVASSSPANWLNTHLPRLGLLLAFDAVRTCTDVDGRKKPDPAVYLAACAAIGVAPHTALAVEDSMHGVAAAKAAGMYCVAVPNEATQGMDFSQADVILSSLAEVSLDELMSRLV